MNFHISSGALKENNRLKAVPNLIGKKDGNSSPQSRRGRKENDYFSFC
jgi:hypothetical protein